MTNLPAVTDDDFEEKVEKTNGAVLVDFGAEWCHPCKQLDPIVEELAQEWQESLRVYALDIDSNVQTTMKMGVMGVPTLILFIDGQAVERLTGYMPKKKLVSKLGPYLEL
ncbi:MAG: thioredoxin [Anaerolineales bacterium]|nr:thioredoxin [Anaerolineales bacterium]